MFMCVKLNSLFDSKMKVLLVTQVLKQGINIKKCVVTIYIPYLNLEAQNCNLFRVYVGAWVKIEIVIENHVC